MSRIKPFYEQKYPVSCRQRFELMKVLEPVLVADRHGQNGNYEIFSQYFDTPDLQFYQDKLNGEFIKTKVRLRFYRSDEQTGWHFPCMEIKRRRGNLVSKHRFQLDLEPAKGILADRTACDVRELILTRCRDEEIRSFFAGKMLIPAVSVYYRRSAFQFRGIDGLRLTFDSGIAGLPAGRIFGAGDAVKGSHVQQRSADIFEIKSYARPPESILNRLVDLGVSQQSFSKYAYALQALNAQGLLKLP